MKIPGFKYFRERRQLCGTIAKIKSGKKWEPPIRTKFRKYSSGQELYKYSKMANAPFSN